MPPPAGERHASNRGALSCRSLSPARRYVPHLRAPSQESIEPLPSIATGGGDATDVPGGCAPPDPTVRSNIEHCLEQLRLAAESFGARSTGDEGKPEHVLEQEALAAHWVVEFAFAVGMPQLADATRHMLASAEDCGVGRFERFAQAMAGLATALRAITFECDLQAVQLGAMALEQVSLILQPCFAARADDDSWDLLAECVQFLCMCFARSGCWPLLDYWVGRLVPRGEIVQPVCLLNTRDQLIGMMHSAAQIDTYDCPWTETQFTTKVPPLPALA